MFRPVDPKPNFPKLEEEILAFWEREKIFEKSLEQTKKGKPFTFYDGPPFATGLPHYGHILASTIKDVIPRYQTMKGRFVRRRWGWDCHGLPIEEIVERQLKISGKKQIEEIGIKKFNETCRSKVLEYVGEWRKTVRRIARWVDFDNSYKTMDRNYMESVWWAFKQIYDKGLVYEGRKVLLYCSRCETPVSNFEVAMDNSYKDVSEEAVTVKFRVKSEKFNDTYLLGWTTTPWTLPGNVALAVGKDIEYVKVKIGEEFYILAKDRANAVIASASEAIPEIAASPLGKLGAPRNDEIVKGKDLIGLEYEPLFNVPDVKSDKSYRVYGASFVNTEEGTGIVHTAVVYGEDDYALGLKEGLPIVPLLDEKGVFNEKAPELVRGQYFKDAEKAIKDDLDKRKLLFEQKTHTRSYPHCWRCDNELFYNAIPAWFINIQKIKKKLLASNKKEINWFPEHLKHGRYEKSVEAAPDWNISRNRYWGNPIPVWKCEKCEKNTVVGSVKELKEKIIDDQLSIIDDNFDLHRPYIDEVVLKCEHCGSEARRITEIFDSWVEAGSMPFASVHFPFSSDVIVSGSEAISRDRHGSTEPRDDRFIFPAQFVAEYIAQTRAWFYVMHVISVVLFEKAPFENVVTTGTILSEKGEKLSKSKRNFPDPWQIIEKYGVDTLRLYLMNSVVMQGDNLFFSEKDLATVHRKVPLILWNVYNYFVTYANATSPTPLLTKEGKGEVMDQWIEVRLQELVNAVTENLDGYDTVRATRVIEEFISDLSTWYLRRSRGREDQAFFQTLHKALTELSKVIAPFAPYMSEEIYRNLKGSNGSVHLENWPEMKKLSKEQEQLLKQMEDLRKIVEEVHALRAKAGIKLRQPLPRLVIANGVKQSKDGIAASPLDKLGAPRNDRFSEELLDILRDEVNVKKVVYGDNLELDTEVDESLKLEGVTRELERQIQAFRKESGLKIGEMAELYIVTESDNIKAAVQRVNLEKTYVSNIEFGISNMEGKEMEIEGEKIKIGIRL